MAKKKQQKKTEERVQRQPRNLSCPFCEGEKIPSYKEAGVLARFLNDRGRIIARSRSGVCSKHQRKLTHQIKRARHLALLPFTV
ncbi:MAG: 30S ribosomal protein S18 [bacterium]|nr:30S ribosomal protein S18 [bacterium]